MAVVSSPFAISGTAVRLPNANVDGRLVVRFIGSADSDYVLVKIDAKEIVSAIKADFMLFHKESLELTHLRIKNMSDLSVMLGAGSGSIYFGSV